MSQSSTSFDRNFDRKVDQNKDENFDQNVDQKFDQNDDQNFNIRLVEKAHEFVSQLKAKLTFQIDELNKLADGQLEDGFKYSCLEDGWVSLKGYAFGFVMHYDDPVHMDITFGPDCPFVGYRQSYIAVKSGNRLTWINQSYPKEKYT